MFTRLNRSVALLALSLLAFSPLGPGVESAQAATVTEAGGTSCSQTVDNPAGVTVSVVGNDCVITFTAIGTTIWTVPDGVTSVRYLIVAGGGGGGAPGAGGAGGLLKGTSMLVQQGNTHSLIVGGGGAGAGSGQTAANGSDSSAFGLVSKGGGGGGSLSTAAGNGGSGGSRAGVAGEAGVNPSQVMPGGSGIPGQGYAGGDGYSNGPYTSGGGGGAGGAGGFSNSAAAGAGGLGLSDDISGTSVKYAGGGGGSWYQISSISRGLAAAGFGGGDGGTQASLAGSGRVNSGGGGGGAYYNTQSGTGGSGVIALRFATPKVPQSALSISSASATFSTPLTVTTTGGNSTGAISYAVANGTASGCSVAAGVLTSTSAGTCLVTATKAGDSTYSSVSSAQTTVTIAKASRTIAFATTSYTIAYGNQDTVLATVSAGTSDGSVTYSAGTSTACTVNSSSGVVSVTQASGSCEITGAVAEGINYLAASTTTAVVVTTATRPATLTASGATVNFGTTYQMNPLTTGLLGNHAISSATYIFQGTGSTVYAPSADMPVNAGTYSVTPSAAVFSSGSASNYSITYQLGTLVISKVSRALSFGASTAATLDYGNTLAVTASPSVGDGSVTYSVGDSTGCTVAPTTGVVTATGSSGTCVITASVAEGTNHLTASTTTSFTVTLAKRAITIKAANLAVEVGDAISPTRELISGTSLASPDAISAVTFTFAGSGATVFASSNSEPTESGTYAVAPSVAVFSSGSASDYVISYSPGTLTIAKRAITVAASTLNVVVGSAVSPAFIITSGSLLTADAISAVTFTFAGSGATVFASSTVAPTAAGTYEVTPSVAVFSSGSLSNYEITFTSAIITIQVLPPASPPAGPGPLPSIDVAEVSLATTGTGQGTLLRVRLIKAPTQLGQLSVIVKLLDFKSALIHEHTIPVLPNVAIVEISVDQAIGKFDAVAFTSNAEGATRAVKLTAQTIKQASIIYGSGKKPPRLLGKSVRAAAIFLNGSSKLTAKAVRMLRAVATGAKASNSRIALTGFHTVSSKGSAYEKSIAERRALTVAKFLREQGVDTWIYYHGFSGAQGNNFAGQPHRVEIRILE